MPVVITARLDLSEGLSESEEASIATIDQALPAELVIKHSRYWASGPDSVPADEAIEIAYEIQANPDNWLVGGQRKAHFLAKVSIAEYDRLPPTYHRNRKKRRPDSRSSLYRRSLDTSFIRLLRFGLPERGVSNQRRWRGKEQALPPSIARQTIGTKEKACS